MEVKIWASFSDSLALLLLASVGKGNFSYLRLVRLDTDSKGHKSSETTMCHGIIM